MQDPKSQLARWLPPLAGLALIVLFASLAKWQLDRAAEKEALAALFATEADAVPLAGLDDPQLYRPVTARGRYLPDRQILIDNIVRDARVGVYVVTPFATDRAGLLLVNRGWLPKPAGGELPDVAVGGDFREIRARVGRLPRVALPPEQSFSGSEDWPRVAVYPDLADVARELGRDVAEPVLLLAPEMADGYRRDWQPAVSGPSTHYGYAFQWSALAVTVAVILGWQLRRRFRA